MHQQQQNHHLRMDSSLNHPEWEGLAQMHFALASSMPSGGSRSGVRRTLHLDKNRVFSKLLIIQTLVSYYMEQISRKFHGLNLLNDLNDLKFHVLRLCLRVAVKLNFRLYIRRYTLPNNNFEYTYPLNIYIFNNSCRHRH